MVSQTEHAAEHGASAKYPAYSKLYGQTRVHLQQTEAIIIISAFIRRHYLITKHCHKSDEIDLSWSTATVIGLWQYHYHSRHAP